MNEIEVAYFPTWRRYLDIVRMGELTERELGKLYLAMMEYQFEGKEPKGMKKSLGFLWSIVREDLDYAREKYEVSVRNGRKAGRKKKVEPEETQENLAPTGINPAEPGTR